MCVGMPWPWHPYIENWPILYQICHENRIAVSNDILAAVENINKKNDA